MRASPCTNSQPVRQLRSPQIPDVLGDSSTSGTPSFESLGYSLSYSLIVTQGIAVEAVSYDDPYFLSKPRKNQSRVEEEGDHLGASD